MQTATTTKSRYSLAVDPKKARLPGTICLASPLLEKEHGSLNTER